MDSSDFNSSHRGYEGWIDVDGDAESFAQRLRRTSSVKRALSERSPASVPQQRSFQSPLRSRNAISKNGPLYSAKTTTDKSVYAIQKEALCRELKTSQQIRKQLEDQLVAMKAELRGKTKALQRASPQIESQYNELLDQYSAVVAQLEAAQLELMEKDNHIDEISTSLRFSNETLEEVELKQQTMQGEFEAAMAELDQVRSDHKTLEARYGAQLKELESVSDELREYRNLCTDFKERLCSVEQELHDSREARDGLNRDKHALKAKLDELKVYTDELQAKQVHTEDKLERQAAEHELVVASYVQRLENEAAECDQKLAAMAEEAQAGLATKAAEIQALGSALKTAKEQLVRIEEQAKTLSRDRDQLHATTSEQSTMQSRRIEELEAEIRELRPKYQLSKQACSNYQAKFLALTRKHEHLEAEIVSLQELESSQREHLSKYAAENKLFDSQRTELALGLEREKSWREHVSQELKRAEALNAEFKAVMEKAEADYNTNAQALRSQLEELELALAESRQDAVNTRTQLEEIEARQAQDKRLALETKQQDDANNLAALTTELAKQAALLTQERKTTRRLQNQIQELKGNIRIVARVRPMVSAAENSAATNMKLSPDEIALSESETSASGLSRNRLMKVQFDRVFGPEATNHEICEETEYLIQSALDGRDVCIFAYGQTGSGKTHTMSGRNGVNAFALSKLMEARANAPADAGYEMFVESVEIYNEQLHDLLDESATAAQGRGPGLVGGKLSIQINAKSGHPELVGAKRVKISTNENAQSVLLRAMRHRSTAATHANQRSSRSHFVFSIRISTPKSQGMLHLVDLAGSERLSHSQTAGDRLRETQAINTSLSSLGNVINALLNKKPGSHIPYRSSKLTHLLQGSLSGNAKTMLLTTLSPELASVEETKSTLRFAEKASRATLM